jgi:hypothetical protein
VAAFGGSPEHYAMIICNEETKWKIVVEMKPKRTEQEE